MEQIGNGPPENGVCLAVKGLHGTCGDIDGHLTVHKKIQIKDELHFPVGKNRILQQTGTGVDPGSAPAGQSDLTIGAAAGGTGLPNILLGKNPQIAR